jgi:hypothetical protein
MRIRVFAVVSLLFVFGATAHAACTVTAHSEQTRGGWYRVFWDPVPGAQSYHVEILRQSEHVRSQDLTEPTVDVRFQVASQTTLTYRITAVNDADPGFTACSTAINVTIPGDSTFRRLTRRLIVPVAGSAPGANGAFFRTSLRLTRTFNGERGRIIFHRFGGTYPANDDPSLEYNFDRGTEDELFFADVVAAMGASGIGYLEIVPNEDAGGVMPRVEARVYNDSPDGTFGGFVEAVNPVDYIGSSLVTVPTPEARFRLNIGIIAMGPTYGILTGTTRTGQVLGTKQIALEPGVAIMFGAREILGADTQPDAVVKFVSLNGSSAILFYTYTDNTTNDPQVFVPAKQPEVIDVNNALQ